MKRLAPAMLAGLALGVLAIDWPYRRDARNRRAREREQLEAIYKMGCGAYTTGPVREWVEVPEAHAQWATTALDAYVSDDPFWEKAS